MATFRVTIEIGPMDQSRFERIEALVDTGATYTVVPRDVLERLGIAPQFRRRFRVADGRIVELNMALVRMGGVAHFLFHPTHIRQQGTKAALKRLVAVGHELGVQWQTSAQIVEWLERRRSIWQVVEKIGGNWLWRLKAPKPVEGATLLQLLPAEKAQMANRFVYGFPFAQHVETLEGENQRVLGQATNE